MPLLAAVGRLRLPAAERLQLVAEGPGLPAAEGLEESWAVEREQRRAAARGPRAVVVSASLATGTGARSAAAGSAREALVVAQRGAGSAQDRPVQDSRSARIPVGRSVRLREFRGGSRASQGSLQSQRSQENDVL